MLLGDLNSRCGSLPDYVVDDSATHMPTLPDDYVNDTEIPRLTEDYTVNANGRLLLDFCKETGLRIANGRVGDVARSGKFTFVGGRGSSIVDFVLVNTDLLHCFTSFTVDDPNIISDHCIISISLCFRSAY